MRFAHPAENSVATLIVRKSVATIQPRLALAHGRGMYWNLTGHKPPRSGNIPPDREDWPSLAAVISKFRSAAGGLPRSIRLPYPMVDNGTLQAGEYGGWLGAKYDPIVMRTPAGKEFDGYSRTLGSSVLELGRTHGTIRAVQPISMPRYFKRSAYLHPPKSMTR